MAKKKEKKEKKAGKRMSKKELAALLIDFFHAKSSETLSMKYIFSELRLTTHPQKMLCVDILHDLLADDYISEIEKYGSEQLIAMVAHGDIDYAVCDESIAQAAIDSLPQLDISTDISFTQFYSWGVSKQSPVLLDSLNTWLTSFRQGKEYKEILHKYYPVK